MRERFFFFFTSGDSNIYRLYDIVLSVVFPKKMDPSPPFPRVTREINIRRGVVETRPCCGVIHTALIRRRHPSRGGVPKSATSKEFQRARECVRFNNKLAVFRTRNVRKSKTDRENQKISKNLTECCFSFINILNRY